MAVQLNLFDLNLLRALDALLRERSVTRAAEQLHVTQQAMSGSLKRLREHFGDELLSRVGLRLELTPLGEALLTPVREAMLQIALAVETTPSFVPGSTRRRFRIALSDYGIMSFLPPLMARLLADAPGIAFEVHEVVATAFAGLEAGDLDLTVQPNLGRLTEESMPPCLRSMPLYTDDFACAVDATMHDSDEMTIERYLALPHAVTRLDGKTKTAVAIAWERHGLNPRQTVTTTTFYATLLMLPGTPMVATAQRNLIRCAARSLPLRLLECPVPIDPLRLELFWHERSDADPGHRFVREACQAVGQGIVPPTG